MTKREIMKLTGLAAGEFTGLKLDHRGLGCNTYSVQLTKTIKAWGRKGDRVQFPITVPFMLAEKS